MTPSRDDAALLAGRYRYVRELGRGGSGRVVEVADESSAGRPPRAIKSVAPEDFARLRVEREALGRLAQPNLVRVHELLRLDRPLPPPFGWPAGTALLVEDRAPGAPGDEALRGLEGKPRLTAALRAAHGVALALSALHSEGLVHGDVKPANVLLGVEGDACLVDLGLAGPGTLDSGLLRGTPAFLAPEALLGTRSVGTDLYALGVTLHRWLGGALPAERGEPLPALPPETPAEVRELVGRLAARDPVDRPAAARDAAVQIADVGRRLGLTLPRPALEPTASERALAASALPFVEPAEGLLEALVGRLDEGGLVRVAGPPGAGRSRLIREAVARLQSRRAASGGVVPTYLRATPDREPPLVPAIVHLCAPPPELAPRWLRAARIARTPRCIVVEDTVVGDTAVEDTVGASESEVHLGPLDEERLTALLRSLVGAEPSAALRRAALEASGGLAGRLIRLFVQAWQAGEDPARAEALAALAAEPGEGAEELPPAAREAALRLALLGGRAPVEALEALRAGLAQLLTRGAASLDGEGRVVLRRDHARRMAERGTAKRRAAIAAGLEPFDARSRSYLAGHQAAAAGGAGREAAVEAFAGLARERLDAGDTVGAERLLEDGVRLLGDDERLARLLFEARLAAARYEEARAIAPTAAHAAEASRRAGHGDRARHELDALQADRAPPAALITRGWLALAAGQLDEGGALAREGLASGVPGAAELAAWVALMRGDPGAAEATAREGLAAGATPREAARLQSTLGAALHQRGARQDALAAHEASLARARALGERHLEATALGNLGAVQLELGELGPALDAMEEAARRLAALGRDRDVARALANLASAALVLGDLEAAAGWVDEAEASIARVHDPTAARHLEGLRAEIALRRGDLGGARRAARAAAIDPRWEPRMVALLARHDAGWAERWSGDTSTFDAALATARVALARDDHGAAREALVGATPDHWAEALEKAFAELDVAEASHDDASAREAAATARALLDAGARTLSAERRARLRRAPRHQRVLGASVDEPAPRGDAPWRRLGALAKRLGRERRPARLGQLIVEAALALVDAERALLVVRSTEGELAVQASAGVGADDAPSRSVVGRALALRAPVVSMDALSDEHLDQAASVHAMTLRSVLCVPLRDRAEVLYMDDRMRTGVFGEDDRRLVRDLADLAAIALDGAERLHREEETNERLARAKRQLEARVQHQARELEALRPAESAGIVAVSPGMRDALALALRVADADVPVLLRGESGTGKELLARAIHQRGPRAGAAFVAESCGALPDTLVESLLFGHERGAFTGAGEAREGLFRAADGGTLFLDEVGEMSPAMQAKILRVLQEGEVRPVGSTVSKPVDVRLVTATHRPLEAWVREGRFREDLFYRIAVMRIDVPPLRERAADIPALARRFLARHGEPSIRISAEAMDALAAHDWPGNARELENEMRRALVLAEDDEVIGVTHLSPALRGEQDDPLDLKAQVATLETRLIREALARTEGNRTQAAELLGVSRYGLQKMIKRLAIE